MRKINFDKGRAERQKRLEKFREKPVKSPGRSLEKRRTAGPADKDERATSTTSKSG